MINIMVNTQMVISQKETPKMSKLLQQFTKLFSAQQSRLEAFMNAKAPKSHADAEYWQKYFEYRGM